MAHFSQPAAETPKGTVAVLGRLCAGDSGTLPAAGGDWPGVLRAALHHGVAPLLFLRTRDHALPAAIRSELAHWYRRNLARNLQLLREQQALLARLEGAGIRTIPLKGPQLAEELYGDAGARQIADLDILIRPEDFAAAMQILRESGFQASDARLDLQNCRDVLLEKNMPAGAPLSLDVHMRLRPYGSRDALTALLWREGFTPENLLLTTCLNVMSHRFARLLPWLDLAAVLSRYERELNWRQVQKKAAQLEWPGGVSTCLEYVSGWEIARVPHTVLVASQPSALERRWIRHWLGHTLEALLERAESLDGPRGTAATLACEKGWLGKLRLARAILFPPAAALRQMDPSRFRSLPLHYTERAARKLREITRRAA